VSASPYWTTDEAAEYLRFTSPRLFREWAARNSIPLYKRGRLVLVFKQSCLDAVRPVKRSKRKQQSA
jgi:excisionase family DNA binding protein